MATKKQLEEKKEYARLLFMQGEAQKSIASKAGVSAATIVKWVADGGWQEQRAAQNITRPQLVNKLLHTIDNLLDEVNKSGDPNAVAGLGDKLAKLSSTIEKLDKKASVVDTIEVFMAFNKWMQYRMSFDDKITPELLKTFNKYQDLFISDQMQKQINY